MKNFTCKFATLFVLGPMQKGKLPAALHYLGLSNPPVWAGPQEQSTGEQGLLPCFRMVSTNLSHVWHFII
jgi:hypothetical protein